MLFIPAKARSGCFCRLWNIPDHMLTNTFLIGFILLAAIPTTILNDPSTWASFLKTHFSSQLFESTRINRKHVHMLQKCNQS